MANEKFIMVSLEEQKTKELAQVISNTTSRKILDYLGDNEEVSEVDLSKELNIPLSTVHYNVKQLSKAGLIEAKKFKWSDKGKKINLYSIARKLVIIAPKGSENLKERLKSLIPLTLVAFFGSAAIYAYQKLSAIPGQKMMAVEEAAFAPTRDMVGGLEGVVVASTPNYALWFLLGSIFVILLTLIYNIWRSRK